MVGRGSGLPAASPALAVNAVSGKLWHVTARSVPHVSLEPRRTCHARELFEVLADPGIYRYLDDAPPASVDALREAIARTESGRSPDGTEQWLNWIVRDADGRMAGYVQATIGAKGDTNVAYVFGTAFHGRGLARQAVEHMLDLLAAAHGARTLLIVCDRRNARSIHLARELGFDDAPPGVLQRRRIADGDILLVRAAA